jgi:uncharacterized membrane protein YjgN (DUF898 family)
MDAKTSPPTARVPQPRTPPAATAHGAIEAHRLRFTGSGATYFRVWIVNVLLSIVTLGFYTPWARRRTAQYFYGHTLVAGSPLEFTAQQKRMVLGFLVLVLLTITYRLAANTGQDLAVSLLLLGGALLAPLIWGSAQRFRLANTRWRGLRLHFAASWSEVYRASWPVFAFALVWIGVFLGAQALVPEQFADIARDRGTPAPFPTDAALPMLGLVLLGLVLSVLCVIRLEFNYSRLRVQRAQVGNEPGRWKPVYMDFVKLWMATLGVFVLSILALCLLFSLVIMLAMGGAAVSMSDFKPRNLGLGIFVLILLLMLGGLMTLVLATAPARAYREAALFKLTWNHIGVSQVARFKCRLPVRGYVWLRLRNMLLTLLTLGLFRPFAMASEYRMKVDSVTLHVKGGVDQLRGQLLQQQPGGIGDAMADAVGLDIIG